MHKCRINSPQTTIVSKKHWQFSETKGINLVIRQVADIVDMTAEEIEAIIAE